MKAFNPEKELKRLNRKFGKRNLIIGIFIILIALTIGSSYAIFSITKQSHVILSGKVGEFTTNDIQLAVLVEGEKTDKFPEKGSGYIFDSLICDNGTTGTWDNNLWILNVAYSKPDKCTVNFSEGATININLELYSTGSLGFYGTYDGQNYNSYSRCGGTQKVYNINVKVGRGLTFNYNDSLTINIQITNIDNSIENFSNLKNYIFDGNEKNIYVVYELSNYSCP